MLASAESLTSDLKTQTFICKVHIVFWLQPCSTVPFSSLIPVKAYPTCWHYLQ